MHPKNIHLNSYDLNKLCAIYPKLKSNIFTNSHNTLTIDFSNSEAVKNLNTALLKKHYQINFWEFPDDNLCPPIPSRIDYIHYLNDLVSHDDVLVLDIGTGATCIYPLLGQSVYNWSFVATDVSMKSLNNVKEIISKNNLQNSIDLRLQKDSSRILNGIVNEADKFTFSMCNPPFYKTLEEANNANKKKRENLKIQKKSRNFSGNTTELCYKGGEKAFLHTYLYESKQFAKQFEWFTSLVSKKELVKGMRESSKKMQVKNFKVIEMKHGNKITRIVAWNF